jgi:hypothetical protein
MALFSSLDWAGTNQNKKLHIHSLIDSMVFFRSLFKYSAVFAVSLLLTSSAVKEIDAILSKQ